VIDAVRTTPLGELFRPGSLVNPNAAAGSNLAKGHYTKADTNSGESLQCSGFCGKLKSPTPGHVPRFVSEFGARVCSLCSY
jgi:hypothetical protein